MNHHDGFLATVAANPLLPGPQLVYADWLDEIGETQAALWLRTLPLTRIHNGSGSGGSGGYGGDGSYGSDGSHGDGDGYGGDGYGGDGDGDDGDGYDGGGDDGGDGSYDGGDGYDGDGYDGGDGSKQFHHAQGIEIMKPGFVITITRTAQYNYTHIGWLIPSGMEIEMYNCRIIRRYGAGNALSQLAKDGIRQGTALLELSDHETLFRPEVIRIIYANPDAWKTECPQPENWQQLLDAI